MITEVSDIGSNALRVVISTKGKGDDPPIGPVFPGQVVHLHGPALKAPMNVTVSSPQTQNDDATITLHCMVDANTETLQAKWKEAGAEIKVPPSAFWSGKDVQRDCDAVHREGNGV